MAKMKIFNTSEQNAFESPPTFNSVERKRFFTLPLMFHESMDSLKTPTNKVCFLLAAGYFKARHRFFARQFHQTDIEFVARQIGVHIDEVQLKTYSRVTYLRHQSLILNYFGFSSFDAAARIFTKTEISIMAQVQFRPKVILLEIIQLLTRKKISIPSYNVLATLIVNAINHHQRSLNEIITGRLSKVQQEMLDALLEKVTGTGSDDKWRYQLTLLKKASQSIRPAKIKANITDMNYLMTLYLEFKPVINHLALGYECVRYYASSVVKSQVHQISRRAEDDRYLHLIAFTVYQSLKLQDMLIDTLLLSVQATINATQKDHKDSYYEERETRNQSVAYLVDNLKKGFLGTIATIKSIIANSQLTADQKVVAIDTAVNDSGSKKTGVEKRINDFKKDMTAIQQSSDYYDMLEDRSLKLQNRVADIVRHTVFDESCGKPSLLEAILHYQKKLGTVDKTAPITFLQACRYLVINFGTSKSPKFTRQRDKYACGALAVLVLLNYNPLYGDHNLRSPMTDAFSYALYFACGKTSGSKVTRDYRPRSATFLGLQRRKRTMAKSFSTLKSKMSLIAQKAVEEKTSELLKEVLLHEIREQLHITQEDMATKLNTKQANVSRTERRRDMKLSTLKRYIEAMGGELDIVAKFASNEVHLNVKEL